MKKVVCIALVAAALLSSLASCSNRLCPAYSSYPHRSR